MSPRTASTTAKTLPARGEQAVRIRTELDEGTGDVRVELRAGAAVDFGESFARRQHPRLERDRSPAPPGRVAIAVPAFVVEQNLGNHEPEIGLPREDPNSGARVSSDRGDLVVGQPFRLVPDRVCDGELADVVQERAYSQMAEPVSPPTESERNRLRELADARAMTPHVGTRVDRLAEPGQHRHGPMSSSRAAETLLLPATSGFGFGAEHPPPHEPVDQCPDDKEDNDRDAPDQAVAPDCLRRRLADVVRDEADEHCPADAPKGVVEEEAPPMHLADAREPGGSDPQDRDETAEEDRLRAVALEKAFRPGQHARGVSFQPFPPMEKPPPAEPTRPVADVVAGGRGRGRNHQHGDDVHVSSGREDACRDESRLARKRNPRRLHSDEEEEDDEPVVVDERFHSPQSRSEPEPTRLRDPVRHQDGVDELAATPVVIPAQTFALEAEPLVQPDCRLVVRKDMQLELLDPDLARPLDRPLEQGPADPSSPLSDSDHEPEVGDVRAGRMRVARQGKAADDAVLVLRDEDRRVR